MSLTVFTIKKGFYLEFHDFDFEKRTDPDGHVKPYIGVPFNGPYQMCGSSLYLTISEFLDLVKWFFLGDEDFDLQRASIGRRFKTYREKNLVILSHKDDSKFSFSISRKLTFEMLPPFLQMYLEHKDDLIGRNVVNHEGVDFMADLINKPKKEPLNTKTA